MTPERAAKLHRESIVIDALDVSVLDRGHLLHMQQGGVTAANVTITLEHDFANTVDLINDCRSKVDRWADIACIVSKSADIHEAKASGRGALILGVQNASPIEGDLRLVASLHALGLRIIQLAYMTGNLLGDGCLEPRNAGLTVFGRAAVAEMNRLGLLIDLSHCGDRTSLEAIDASNGPVAFTHACAAAVCPHPRNKSDASMKALAEKGGVMGITSLAAFVAVDWRTADLQKYLDQIDYAVNLMGIEHVGLGLDFTESQTREFLSPVKWGGVHLPTGIDGVTEFPIPYSKGIQGSEEIPHVTSGLLDRGYSEPDVAKILGGNFLRLLDQVWR
jgi:membrane dipeptidase